MASSSVWENIDANSFNLISRTLKSVALTIGDTNLHGSAVMVSFQRELFALGKNKNDCLGIDSDETRVPLKVQGISLVSGVSMCGVYGDAVAHTREGKLYHWGANVHGNTCKKPVLIEGLPNIIDAGCAQGHYLALTHDGKVYEWRGTKTNEDRLNRLSTTPTAVVFKDDIVGIACGPSHSLAVTKLGEVYSFGFVWCSGWINQPVTKIPLPGETVVKVACGYGHSLALTQSGKVYTWGWNGWHLGDDGSKIHSTSPLQVGGKIGRFVDIATNGWRTNATLTDTGAVYIWGKDDKGGAVLKPTLTQHTELQQAFSNICPSNCSWTYKDSYSMTQEDPALLGMEMASTFNVEDFSDLTLLVGNKEIYVHKYVLHLRSEFFRTWLQERWTDKSKKQLELTCYDYDVYLSYLWFLYSGEIKTSPQHILELWDLADAYGEEKLKSGCETLISKNMTMKNLLHFKSRTMRHSDLNTEQAEIGRELELKLAKLEDNLTKLEESNIQLETENLELRKLESKFDKELKLETKLEEDNLKFKKAISKLKNYQTSAEMAGTKLKSDPTILQQPCKIQGDKSTNPELAVAEKTEIKNDEKVDIVKPETVKLNTKEIQTKTQGCESEIQEAENKAKKNYFEIVEIHRKEERSYEELLQDYTELDQRYRELESEKSILEEGCNRLQEKHKKLRDLLLKLDISETC